MNARWAPIDFIVNGEFADTRHLRQLVGEIRQSLEAECCVLLVHHAGEVVQSLMYVDDRNAEREAMLQDRLAKLTWQDADSRALSQILTTGNGILAPLDSLLGTLEFSTLESFCKTFSGSRGRLFVSRLAARLTVSGGIRPPLIGVLCVDPDPSKDPLQAAIDDLSVAVNASAQIYLIRMQSRRELLHRTLHKAEREIQRHFDDFGATQAVKDESEASSTEGSTLSPFEEFLACVLGETDSSHGAIFMRGDEPDFLESMARMGPSDGDHTGRLESKYRRVEGKQIDISRNAPGVVATVFKKSRMIMFNDGMDFKQMNQKTGLTQFSPTLKITSDAALCVPIIARPGRSAVRTVDIPSRPTIGVLNLEKTLRGERPGAQPLRPFSLDECWFAQEAADYLIAAWTRGWNDQLYRIIKDLYRRLRPFSINPPIPEESLDQARTARELPADFAKSRIEIRQLLDSLCESVQGISASAVRVLSVDQSEALVLAAYPKSLRRAIQETRESIRLTDAYPMAEVLRNGKPTYGPSTALPAPQPSLQSYFCAPITLGQRCVGVVTFASKFPTEILQSQEAALWEATETIARAIEFAQTQALARVVEPTTQVMHSLHELQKLPDLGKEHLKAVKETCEKAFAGNAQASGLPRLLGELEEISRDFVRLEKCLDVYRARQPAHATSKSTSGRSLRELVEEILEQENARELFRVFERKRRPAAAAASGNDLRIEATSYERCLNALRDLIRNATPALGNRPRERGRITIHYRRLGGRQYGCITISNPMKDRLNPALRPVLYREPIPKGRLRYGAFLAAWLVRTIGGDIHLSGKRDSKFSVTAEIPLQVES